jgi:hypothetical protein
MRFNPLKPGLLLSSPAHRVFISVFLIKYSRLTNWRRHLTRHQRRDDRTAALADDRMDTSNPGFHCPTCNKDFRRPDRLAAHNCLFQPLGSQAGPTTQFTLVEQGSSMAIRVASMSPKEQFDFCMGRKIAVPNVFPGEPTAICNVESTRSLDHGS